VAAAAATEAATASVASVVAVAAVAVAAAAAASAPAQATAAAPFPPCAVLVRPTLGAAGEAASLECITETCSARYMIWKHM
jgi:hypothetical protein